MKELNKSIQFLDMPARLRKLPLSAEGYPIPYFVPYINGKPDFRGMDGEKLGVCIRHKRCWLCGEQLGRYMAFVIGPMCGINLVSSEPPSHRGCAAYAVQACPFLSNPKMRRNEKDMPEGTVAGIMIKRNPGVTMIWVTEEYRLFRADGGVLFKIGNPMEVRFYAEGRLAARDEVMHSIDTGLPLLRGMAEKEGVEAMNELRERYIELLNWLPREESNACTSHED